MNLKPIVLATILVLGTNYANAGTFVNLTNGNGTNVSTANGGVVIGDGSTATDLMLIENVSATYVANYDDLTPHFLGGTGDVVAQTIDYRTYAAFGDGSTLSTGTLNLLAWQVTRGVDLSDAGVGQADIYDFVYRDSSDNKLVFGTRYLNRVENDEEANYLYRYGFSNFETSVAWTYSTNSDLNLYSAAKTSTPGNGSEFPLDADVVRQQGDFSASEGAPWSALFLVKTNAEAYALGSKAIGFSQAGDEGQAPFMGSIGGYVPIAAVPEPESYALMLLGMGVVAAFARRHKKQA